MKGVDNKHCTSKVYVHFPTMRDPQKYEIINIIDETII